MKVKLERCRGDRLYYRATVLKDGARYLFNSENWTRITSGELRDHLVRDYGVNRNSIRII